MENKLNKIHYILIKMTPLNVWPLDILKFYNGIDSCYTYVCFIQFFSQINILILYKIKCTIIVTGFS